MSAGRTTVDCIWKDCAELKKLIAVLALLITAMTFTTSLGALPASAADVPIINMAWDFDLHASALLAAVSKGKDFKDCGYYMQQVVEKQQYYLMKGDKKLALVNTIVTKGSSETAVLMGQKRIDCCVNSSTGMMSARDQGTDVQILCPIHVDGISLVFPPTSKVYGWDAVKKTIKESKAPFRIGFHSPTSAPRILIQSALTKAGIKVSLDPNDKNAEVILVNLNGSKNLMASLSNNLVDAWVGPSHHPELAESNGFGKIALKLKDFPPKGQWFDFPCCVFAANRSVIKEHPEVMQGMVTLLTCSANWCQKNRAAAAPILAGVIGIPAQVVKKAEIIFTTKPTKKWLEGEALYVTMLNQLGIFEGDMKGKSFKQVEKDLFNFQFIGK